MQVASA